MEIAQAVPIKARYLIAASVRRRIESFLNILLKCVRTVAGEMARRAAISLLVQPSATKARISFSLFDIGLKFITSASEDAIAFDAVLGKFSQPPQSSQLSD